MRNTDKRLQRDTSVVPVEGEIPGFFQPESICRSGQYVYVSNSKNGSGYISRVDLKTNKIEGIHFLPSNNASIPTHEGPFGIKVVGDTLYGVTFNHLLAFNLHTKDRIFDLVVPQAGRLNDVELVNRKLLLSETQGGTIYEYDLKAKVFKEFIPDPTEKAKLSGINGMVWDAQTNTIYATANKNNASPNSLLAIDPETKKVSVLYQKTAPVTFFFDGMCLVGRRIYFTDWKHEIYCFTIPQKGQKLSEYAVRHVALPGLKTGTTSMDGPPDVIVSDDETNFIFPLFQSGKILIKNRP